MPVRGWTSAPPCRSISRWWAARWKTSSSAGSATRSAQFNASPTTGSLRTAEPVGVTGPVTPEPMSDAALAADLAEEAGKLLLAVRARVGFDHPWLLGDEGDSQANALLLKRLHAERPGDAVLSEEAYDDLNRLRSDRVWIVDPLDGTREFSWEGRDDWAVHVALWQRRGGPNGSITDAAVALPAMGELYRSDTVTAPTAELSGPIRSEEHTSE